MAYKQLTRKERERVEVYLSEGYGPSAIARKLGRDKGTLSRERKRNSLSGIGYRGEFADYHAHRRRREANERLRKIEDGSPLAFHIFNKLRERWSPEDISADLRKQADLPYVSPGTIYRFIEKEHPELKQYLLILSHKKPRPRGHAKKELIKDRRWIDERPAEVEERKKMGHWEGDTIVSGCRKKAIATFAERASDYLMAKKMEDRTAPEMTRVASVLFVPLPKNRKRSCTSDSGPEFAEHKTMEEELNITMYFAHPYHSWERGINENLNRELRRFFPKGTNFTEIKEWELDWAVNLINHKPRKRLGYRTPHEVFHGKSSVVAL